MYSYTMSGSLIDYNNPHRSKLNKSDFYHRLVNVYRFSGDLDWNIAQHSLLVYCLSQTKFICDDLVVSCNNKIQKQSLLHDFHEALIGDIPTPLKIVLGAQIKTLEQQFDKEIYYLFDVPLPNEEEKKIISEFDRLALIIEGMYLNHPLITQDLISDMYSIYRGYIYSLPIDKSNEIDKIWNYCSTIDNSLIFKGTVNSILKIKENYGERITC